MYNTRNDEFNLSVYISEELNETNIKKRFSNLKSLNQIIETCDDLKFKLASLTIDLSNLTDTNTNDYVSSKLSKLNEIIPCIYKLWYNKMVREINMGIFTNNTYHEKFETFDFEWERVNKFASSLEEKYQKLFYFEWIKTEFRCGIDMNTENIISPPFDKSEKLKELNEKYGIVLQKINLSIVHLSETLYRNYSDLTQVRDNMLYDIGDKDLSTKKLISQLLDSLQKSNIKVDKEVFTKSFGHEYNETIRTSYAKIIYKVNPNVRLFYTNLAKILDPAEKEIIIEIIKANKNPT